MSYKTYVVQENGEYRYLKAKGFIPKDHIPGKLAYNEITKELEDPRWIQLEQIADKEGNLIPTFTVDLVKKSEVEAQDLADKAARDLEEATRLATKDALLDKLIALDIDTVNDLKAIKEIFKDIRAYFLYKYDADIKEKEKKDKKVK